MQELNLTLIFFQSATKLKILIWWAILMLLCYIYYKVFYVMKYVIYWTSTAIVLNEHFYNLGLQLWNVFYFQGNNFIDNFWGHIQW